jgi:hypothetical protein
LRCGGQDGSRSVGQREDERARPPTERWYIATPQAVNPLQARDAGFNDAELGAERGKLLEAAQG